MIKKSTLQMSLFILLIGVLLTGCASAGLTDQLPTLSLEPDRTQAPNTTGEAVMLGSSPSPEVRAEYLLVRQAINDLARRLNLPVKKIELLEYKVAVWPDSSLGCPEPGMAYNQVPQNGALIRLGFEGNMYFYHSGGSQAPFLCENTSSIVPEITPKQDEFVPPPDDEID